MLEEELIVQARLALAVAPQGRPRLPVEAKPQMPAANGAWRRTRLRIARTVPSLARL